MFEIIKSGGWLMLPILLGSVAALAICVERLLALRTRKIAPPQLLGEVWGWVKNNQLDASRIRELKQSSPLGLLLATGLLNARHGREIMKESIEEAASLALFQMQRYLNALGTIALVEPMFGLVGAVLGIMQVFNRISLQGGVSDPSVLAGGISEALITTAAGLIVAIPATMMHRFFNGRIERLIVLMEQETLKLVDALHGGERRLDPKIPGVD